MLEFALLLALSVLAYQHYKLRQKQRIIRQVFITHSDWCANRIAALSRSAVEQITDLADEAAIARGYVGETQDYVGDVRHDILKAPAECREQIDQMQAQLETNSISPLSYRDLDAMIFTSKRIR